MVPAVHKGDVVWCFFNRLGYNFFNCAMRATNDHGFAVLARVRVRERNIFLGYFLSFQFLLGGSRAYLSWSSLFAEFPAFTKFIAGRYQNYVILSTAHRKLMRWRWSQLIGWHPLKPSGGCTRACACHWHWRSPNYRRHCTILEVLSVTLKRPVQGKCWKTFFKEPFYA